MTDDDDRRLSDAIAAATGGPQSYIGGGIGPGGRVAWIEDTAGSYYLHTAGPGIPDVNREIETYNPWFGCTVSYVGWFGDEVIAIYREKHRTIVWAVPVRDPEKQRITDIEDNAVVGGDTVFFEGDEPGLVEAMALPLFEPRSPMPFAGDERWGQLEIAEDTLTLSKWEQDRHAWVELHRLRLPAPHQRAFADASLAGRVERALTAPDPPPPVASLVVACVASAFWLRELPIYTTYHGKKAGGESVHWLPVYWHELLVTRGRREEASELLAFLDRLAAPLATAAPDAGWDTALPFEDAVLDLAVRHVRRRAGVLANVIRTGALPRHTFCYLFDDVNGQPRAVRLDGMPRSVTSVWEQLLAAKPRSLSRRGR